MLINELKVNDFLYYYDPGIIHNDPRLKAEG